MKKAIVLLSAALFLFASCDKMGKASIKTDVDSASYALGIKYGEGFKQIQKDVPDFNYDVFFKAIKEILDSQKTAIDPKDAERILMEFGQKKHRKDVEKNTTEEREFLEKNKSKANVTTAPSGLQYEIITAGTGKGPQTLDDTVVVHYKGTFLDGKVFDSSYDRGMPWEAPLNSTIQGWQEVMPIFKTGTKMKLYVPSNLAYGERMDNKMLIFEIEVLGVKPAKKGKK